MEARLESDRMTVDEFCAEGRRTILPNGYLHDLWLVHRHLRCDEWPGAHGGRSSPFPRWCRYQYGKATYPSHHRPTALAAFSIQSPIFLYPLS